MSLKAENLQRFTGTKAAMFPGSIPTARRRSAAVARRRYDDVDPCAEALSVQ